MCECIKKRRLASVGIADDANSFEIIPLSIVTMESTSAFVGFEFFEDGTFFFLQVTLHYLSIGLSLSLGIFGPTTLARELHTHTVDTRSHMLDSRELYLELGLWRDSMQCKYLQYQVYSIPSLYLGF